MKLLLLTIAFVVSGTMVAGASDRMNARQIKAMFPGIYEGIYGSDTSFVVEGKADGSIRGVAEGKHDSGKWWVEGNRLCMAWKVWSEGKSRCRRVEKRNGWIVGLNSKGKVKLRVRRR